MENLCRTCLRSPETLFSLYEDDLLAKKILVISSIWVDINDNLPTTICAECISNINLLYNFRKVIINSNLELKERYEALKKTEHEEATLLDTQNIESPCLTEEITLDNNDINESETTKDHHNTTTKNNIVQSSTTKGRKKFNLRNLVMYQKKMYHCKICNFSCPELSKWQNHRRTNHCEPGICNFCGKVIRMDNLRKHIKSHTEPPVQCTKCAKIFKNTESLRCHMIIHSGKELTCAECGKRYKYRAEYNRHIKRHSPNGYKTIKCVLCEKLFSDKKDMKKHMQTHTGERPHICQYCHRGFSSGYALKTHTRQHTNEKPYMCEYCPAAFHQKVSLVTHLKSKHSSSIENN